jgi:hypothetical protein
LRLRLCTRSFRASRLKLFTVLFSAV